MSTKYYSENYETFNRIEESLDAETEHCQKSAAYVDSW